MSSRGASGPRKNKVFVGDGDHGIQVNMNFAAFFQDCHGRLSSLMLRQDSPAMTIVMFWACVAFYKNKCYNFLRTRRDTGSGALESLIQSGAEIRIGIF